MRFASQLFSIITISPIEHIKVYMAATLLMPGLEKPNIISVLSWHPYGGEYLKLNFKIIYYKMSLRCCKSTIPYRWQTIVDPFACRNMMQLHHHASLWYFPDLYYNLPEYCHQYLSLYHRYVEPHFLLL